VEIGEREGSDAKQLLAAPGPAHEHDGGWGDAHGGGEEGGYRLVSEAVGGGRRHADAECLPLPAHDLVSQGPWLDPHGEEGPAH
jgi:hypothetical protein